MKWTLTRVKTQESGSQVKRGSAGTQRNANRGSKMSAANDLERAMWKQLVSLKRGISVN